MSKLVEILDYSRDGEWGKDSPFTDSLEMRVLRGTDFDKFHELNFSSLPTRHIAKKHAFNKQLIGNDIVLETAGGTQKKPTGRAVFITETALDLLELPVVCASFARVLRINPAKAFPEFVYWALQASYNDGTMSAFNTQHTGVSRFQYTEFSTRFELYLPEILTQKKIASVLSAYDDLIANNERRIKILEEMAQSIYREWFVNYRFPGHENVKMVDSELGEIPEGWEVVNIKELLTYSSGAQPPKSTHIYEYQEGYIRFIQNRDYRDPNAYITFIPDSPKNKVCTELDIMVDKYGAAGTVRHGLKGAYNVALAKLSPTQKNTREYLRSYLSQDRIKGYLEQSSGASTRASLNAEHFNFPMAFPDASTLGSWEDLSTGIISWIFSCKSINQNLRQTRDLLLPKLISGQLDVGELDIKV